MLPERSLGVGCAEPLDLPPIWCFVGPLICVQNDAIMKTNPSKKFPKGKSAAARPLGAQTRAIHAGEGNRHGVGGPVSAPISRTSTFTFSSSGEMKRWAEGKSKAYIYTRYGNPSLAIAQGKIAAL